MPRRHDNYFFARNRNPESDELPWLRIPGLAKIGLPRPVVLINGAFDILQTGHMKIIFAARDHAGAAGTVVCAMDSDARVKKTKGPERPILTWIERATSMGFMPVDYLLEIDSDPEMTRLIAAIKPDLRVQGREYVEHASKYPHITKMFVADAGMHTSTIVKRILERYKP